MRKSDLEIIFLHKQESICHDAGTCVAALNSEQIRSVLKLDLNVEAVHQDNSIQCVRFKAWNQVLSDCKNFVFVADAISRSFEIHDWTAS